MSYSFGFLFNHLKMVSPFLLCKPSKNRSQDAFGLWEREEEREGGLKEIKAERNPKVKSLLSPRHACPCWPASRGAMRFRLSSEPSNFPSLPDSSLPHACSEELGHSKPASLFPLASSSPSHDLGWCSFPSPTFQELMRRARWEPGCSLGKLLRPEVKHCSCRRI